MKILDVLAQIENSSLGIDMLPNQDTWMGDVLYKADNGWTIAVFSDCYCWDYISYILDENGEIIYKYDKNSPISDYECPRTVASRVYGIFDLCDKEQK